MLLLLNFLLLGLMIVFVPAIEYLGDKNGK